MRHVHVDGGLVFDQKWPNSCRSIYAVHDSIPTSVSRMRFTNIHDESPSLHSYVVQWNSSVLRSHLACNIFTVYFADTWQHLPPISSLFVHSSPCDANRLLQGGGSQLKIGGGSSAVVCLVPTPTQ